MSAESESRSSKRNGQRSKARENGESGSQIAQYAQVDLIRDSRHGPEISENVDGGFRLHVAARPASDLPDRCFDLLDRHGLKYKSLSIMRDSDNTSRQWISIATGPCSVEAARRFVSELRTLDGAGRIG